MNNSLPAFMAALTAALVLTPTARRAAIRWGFVDRPDGKRKLQKKPVPLLGGVAVYVSLLAGLTVAVCASPVGDSLLNMALIVGGVGGFVCLFGCIDDRVDISPRTKLLLQIVATLPIVLRGYAIERVAMLGFSIELGWIGIPLSMLWLLACINALNLLDGMDGLASVVGLCAAAAMALIAINSSDPHMAVMAAVLVGALIGFLAFNLPPATIYLGDAGSMVIGLVVGLLTISGATNSSGVLPVVIPIVVMTIPLLDTSLAVVRRKLSGSRFDVADRGHIHHCLLNRGMSNWQALGAVVAMCATTGVAAVAAVVWHFEALAWVTAILVVAVLVATRAFGSHELSLIKQAIAGVSTRATSRLQAVSSLGPSVASFDATEPAFELAWQQLIDEAARLDAKSLELYRVDDGEDEVVRSWQATGSDTDMVAQWRFTVRTPGDTSSSFELRTGGSGDAASEDVSREQLNRLLLDFGQDWAHRSPEHVGDGVNASRDLQGLKRAA